MINKILCLLIGCFMSVMIFAQSQASATQEATPSYRTHIVSKGETLYSLARKYNCTTEKIVAANPSKVIDGTIKLGQRLQIPSSNTISTLPNKAEVPAVEEANEATAPLETVEPMETIVEVQTNKSTADSPIYHTVQAEETLYALSRRYSSSPAKIKAWNKLTSNNIIVGKSIIVGWQGDEPAIDDIESATEETNTPSTNTAPLIYSRRNSNFAQVYQDAQNNGSGRYKLVSGEGMAICYKGDHSSGNNKLYAIHKQAAMHSILKLTNPVNGKTVFVKVIGRIPDTEENANVEMQLPTAVTQKLRMVDEKFILKYSYHERQY